VKLLFTPLSILGGLIAGALGKKVFDAIWALIERPAAPPPSLGGR
jgi:hypothetical protein